ncbi:unnamed protein product [Discosporangium mesarthrocarpum]
MAAGSGSEEEDREEGDRARSGTGTRAGGIWGGGLVEGKGQGQWGAEVAAAVVDGGGGGGSGLSSPKGLAEPGAAGVVAADSNGVVSLPLNRLVASPIEKPGSGLHRPQAGAGAGAGVGVGAREGAEAQSDHPPPELGGSEGVGAGMSSSLSPPPSAIAPLPESLLDPLLGEVLAVLSGANAGSGEARVSRYSGRRRWLPGGGDSRGVEQGARW